MPIIPGKKNSIKQAELPVLAKDINLIDTIGRHITELGVVGEKDTALLEYLTGTSRLISSPLRLIVRGESTSGKSHPLETISKLFPDGEVHKYTTMTATSLYRMEKGSLIHKFLLGGERSRKNDENQAEATAAVRQLLSEHRISYRVNIPTSNGGWESVVLKQEGPVSFAETTTSSSVFKEDLNRCLQIYADESCEQTQRILLEQSDKYTTYKRVDSSSIIKQHVELQQCLEPVSVAIPYARRLAERLPNNKLVIRRLLPQILSTIETIALLFQHQRGVDSDKRVVATFGDYCTARRLLLKPLSRALDVSSKASDNYQIIRTKIKSREFSTADLLREKCFSNRATIKRAMEELESVGVVKLIAKGTSHKPNQWVWTGKEVCEILPTAKDLSSAMSQEP